MKIIFKKVFPVFLCLFFTFSIFGTQKVSAQNDKLDYAVVLDATASSEDESGTQKIRLEIKSGKNSHGIFETSFKQPTDNIKRDLAKGDIVLVNFVVVNNQVQSVTVQDFYRLPNAFWIPLLFLLLFLVVAIIRFRNKVYLFVGMSLAIGVTIAAVIFLKINIIIVIIPAFSIMFALVLFLIYRKISIAIMGLILPIILGLGAFLITYLSLQIADIQISYLTILSNYYHLQNSDYTEGFYAATLISSLVGSVYIAFHQILESVKIKITEIELTKKQLTLRSFKHTIKNFDSIIFPCLGFMIGIMLSIFIFLEKSMGVEGALNNDYWVAFTILCFISMLSWVATIPVCALISGIILGRMEKHKVFTDKTIGILD